MKGETKAGEGASKTKRVGNTKRSYRQLLLPPTPCHSHNLPSLPPLRLGPVIDKEGLFQSSRTLWEYHGKQSIICPDILPGILPLAPISSHRPLGSGSRALTADGKGTLLIQTSIGSSSFRVSTHLLLIRKQPLTYPFTSSFAV